MTTTPATDAREHEAAALRFRRATPADAVELARLRFAFRAGRGRPVLEAPDAFRARCEAWMRPRLEADSRWAAWLAERDLRAVGNVWVQIVEKIPNPGGDPERHAYISNFFVLPDERNAGCGTALLQHVLGHCRSRDVDTVFLWPTPRSVPFYRRAGFAPPADVLVLELRPRPAP